MFIIPAAPEVAFRIFNFPIYWYGITMALAILAGFIVSNKLFNVLNPQYQKDIIFEYAPWIILCGILGARFYFCFLTPYYYLSHPFEILNIRGGGLSIHGGILGGVLGLMPAVKHSKVPITSILDAMACGTALGQAIGRWGNYFNSEAYGFPVASQNWGLYIPLHARIQKFMNYSLYHPAFLYESIFDLFAFLILLWLFFKTGRKYRGLIFFSYLTIYATIRFFTEQIRIDSALNIGTIPVAVIVSVILFFTGIFGIIYILHKNN